MEDGVKYMDTRSSSVIEIKGLYGYGIRRVCRHSNVYNEDDGSLYRQKGPEGKRKFKFCGGTPQLMT